MPFQITESVYWVGKKDWELRHFHGEEYSTNRGTTYNAYLIKDQKIALVDSVWAPFSKEFIQELSRVVDLNRIDYIIANHAEIDHSGALVEINRLLPDIPIYCTANGVKSLKGHYHYDWNFNIVKTGDRLSLGSKELVFIEAPMLHWPDSMFCYLTGEKILFSNDAFGQHYASEFMFNDLVEPSELFSECIKYYANILTPFSSFVKKKIEEVIAMDVPLSMICPSHGVIWRDNPVQIVNKYMEWAQNYAENQVTVIYDTMWNGTRRIAESIAEGLRHNDKNLTVKMYNCARSDKNDIVTEVFKSKAILVGSPTINRGILSSVAGLMEEIRGLSFKNKMAAAFCTYGWSGEGRATIETLLDNAGFKRLSDGPKILWYPTEESLSMCRSYGAMISAALKENHSKKG